MPIDKLDWIRKVFIPAFTAEFAGPKLDHKLVALASTIGGRGLRY